MYTSPISNSSEKMDCSEASCSSSGTNTNFNDSVSDIKHSSQNRMQLLNSNNSTAMNIPFPPETPSTSAQAIEAGEPSTIKDLKNLTVNKIQENPIKIINKLRSAINMPVGDATRYLRLIRLEKSDEGRRKLYKEFVNLVFEWIGEKPEKISNIKFCLGVSNSTNSATLENTDTLNYLSELGDRELNISSRICPHFAYDRDTGVYTYHTTIATLYERLVDDTHEESNEHQMIFVKLGRHIVTKWVPETCERALNGFPAQEGTPEYREGDTVAVRKYQCHDIHSNRMLSLLNIIGFGLQNIGLPEGIDSLKVNVQIAGGYEAKQTLIVFQKRGGTFYRFASDVDKILSYTNCLDIEFKTKSALAELISDPLEKKMLKEETNESLAYCMGTPRYSDDGVKTRNISSKTLSDQMQQDQVEMKITLQDSSLEKSVIDKVTLLLDQPKQDLEDKLQQNTPMKLQSQSFFYRNGRFGASFTGI